MTVHHIPGIKNEMADYISRNNFDALLGQSSEALAKEAFQRMDVQLDLSMRTAGILEGWSLTDYQSEYKEILQTLSTGLGTRVIDGHQWYKSNQYLFYEDRMVVPEARLDECLQWSHLSSGHTGANRSVDFFRECFYSSLTLTELRSRMQTIVDACGSHTSKQSDSRDSCLISSLPILYCANSLLYVDFIHGLPRFGGYDSCLVVTCGLSRFTRVLPCNKKITGEQTVKLLVEQWFEPSGAPKQVHSDEDVCGQLGEGQRLTTDAPYNGVRHPPRGRPSATPTASNAGPQGRTLWAGAGSPRLHRPRPGPMGRRTLAARSRGRAAGGGTAPDTRRPSQRWQASHSGDGPPPPLPQHAAPTGHASQGESVGPPQQHTRPHSTWVADPNSPPSGRAVGGGTAPDPRRPSQWWKASPLGTPFRHPHSEHCRPAGAHGVGPVRGPHARINRTRDTRVTEPCLPAPEDGRPGEGQRLTPSAPHNGGRHLPWGHPSATPTASNAGPQRRTLWSWCWVPTPAPTAPGAHGSRNPGCPLQRTGSWRRDSA